MTATADEFAEGPARRMNDTTNRATQAKVKTMSTCSHLQRVHNPTRER